MNNRKIIRILIKKDIIYKDIDYDDHSKKAWYVRYGYFEVWGYLGLVIPQSPTWKTEDGEKMSVTGFDTESVCNRYRSSKLIKKGIYPN
jgi:hypothetical protein